MHTPSHVTRDFSVLRFEIFLTHMCSHTIEQYIGGRGGGGGVLRLPLVSYIV